MSKQTITAIGNREGYYEIDLIKSKNFFYFLKILLNRLDIAFKIDYEIDGKRCSPLNYVDYWEEYKNENFHVEVFYGYKRVILIIRLAEKDKGVIKDVIDKYCVFLKSKK